MACGTGLIRMYPPQNMVTFGETRLARDGRGSPHIWCQTCVTPCLFSTQPLARSQLQRLVLVFKMAPGGGQPF